MATGLSVVIEQSITIGNIIEIVSIIVGGIVVFVTLRNTVANIKIQVDGMQIEIRKLGEILVAQADIRAELRGIDRRVSATEQDIRDLRKGRGFIQGDRTSVDGEYP
jgi:hypothetical protein